ncbi:MAG TPA: hypothetical protein VF941_09545 [Clostridia bacterium]
MSVNKLIIDTLKPLNTPVSFQAYSGTASTYITFFIYNELGEAYSENKEKATGFYVQVDIWSKTDYTQLAKDVKTAMENAGFKRTSGADLYESETETYHKAIRFVYVQAND